MATCGYIGVENHFSAITFTSIKMPRRGRSRGGKTAVPVRGGWDVLPHGLGTAQDAGATPQSFGETATTQATSSRLAGQELTLATIQSTAQATPSKPSQGEAISQATGSGAQISVGFEVAAVENKSQTVSSASTTFNEVTTTTAPSSRSLATTEEVSVSKKRKRRIPTQKNLLDNEGFVPVPDELPITKPEIGLRRSKRINVLAVNSHVTEEPKPEPKAEPKSEPTSRKRPTKIQGQQEDANPDKVSEQDPKPKKEKRKPKKTKDNPYGLMPGETPFPDWAFPTPEQCEEVYRLLADMHDDVKPQAPEVIPAPSLDVAGCGEVPSVLDALLRTLLSGATTFDNADKMIKGLVEKFSILDEGIGKGSIDWDKARLSPIEDTVDAIRVGGLGNSKAKSIKAILDMVYQETVERRDAYLEERKTGVEASVIGASVKTKGQKDLEILKVEKNILSLDHIRDLSVDEAMKEFTKYPGVGVKTSACVILFCLQRPCFAVDTHVDKFSRWLRWVPGKATVDDIFSHLEVRCPNHLKYGLHQLFIRHGKTCGRCRRHTVEGTEEWKTIECPLEHLLDRFDKRQSKAKPKEPKKKQKTDTHEDLDAGVKDEEADGLDGAEGL